MYGPAPLTVTSPTLRALRSTKVEKAAYKIIFLLCDRHASDTKTKDAWACSAAMCLCVPVHS